MLTTEIDNFIRQLYRSRHMSLMDLARMLGYKSQTSLTRIMQQTANRESLLKFADKLQSCKALALTLEERTILDDLVERRDFGDERFAAMRGMRELLRGEPLTYAAPLQLDYLLGNKASTSFLGHFSTLRLRRIFILNCEYVPIFQDIALLMGQHDFPVIQYMYASEDVPHTVRAIHAALPMLFATNYSSYSYRMPDSPGRTVRGLITSDLVAYEAVTADNRPANGVIVFASPSRGLVYPNHESIDSMMKMLPTIDLMQPVRIPTTAEQDLLAYSCFCADLERGHATYCIKPDLGLMHLPVDILEKAVRDAAPPEVLRHLPELVQITKRRHQDMLEKSVPQHLVMKRGALLHFVNTGRFSDHLYCCRAFVPAERTAILRYLRDTLMALPDFHVYLLKNDDAFTDNEVTLYGDTGLSFIKPGTDYDWSRSHAEILVTQPEFLQVFQHFFTDSILRCRVEKQSVTIDFLDALIEYSVTYGTPPPTRFYKLIKKRHRSVRRTRKKSVNSY